MNLSPQACRVKPGEKHRGIKTLIGQGSLYRSGRDVLLILRDEGRQVLVAPVTARAKPSRLHIKAGRAGTVLLDKACVLDKSQLDRKVGELPDPVMGAVAVAVFHA